MAPRIENHQTPLAQAHETPTRTVELTSTTNPPPSQSHFATLNAHQNLWQINSTLSFNPLWRNLPSQRNHAQKLGLILGIGIRPSSTHTDSPIMSTEEYARFRLNEFLNNSPSDIQSIPEYQQRSFFLIVGDHHTQADFSEQMNIARQILEARSDTHITLFVPPEELRIFSDEIRNGPYHLRHFLINGRLDIAGEEQSSMWAQDFGEVVRRANANEFLYPLPAPSGFQFSDNSESRRIASLDGVQVPFLFQGGDITQTTTLQGRSIAIVGQETLDLTRCYYRQEAHYEISDDEIRRVIKRALGVSDVVLLSNQNSYTETRHQTYNYHQYTSPYGFHVDQYASFPAPGIAVMPSPDFDISGNPDRNLAIYRENLIAYTDQLRQAGFRIIQIPTDVSHIQNFQAYTNGIPLQLENGRNRLILPSFPHSEILEARIRRTLEQEGFEVRFVRNVSYSNHGNTHCITGSAGR